MVGLFVIWVEDADNNVTRAFTWRGSASEGISRARAEALARGLAFKDIWATPISNHNEAAA